MKMNKLNYNAPQVTVITLGVENGICQASEKVDANGFVYYEVDEGWE